MNYTIAPIATVYRGVSYRSRLEAKWAAFMDRIGWCYDYEPFDLGDWSPDFLIRIASGQEFLAEVKPITEFDAAASEKMAKAAKEARVSGAIWLLASAPRSNGDHLSLGWQGTMPPIQGSREADEKYACRLLRFYEKNDGQSAGPAFWYPLNLSQSIDPLQLWSDGCNEVQWHPRSVRQ